MTWTIGAQVSTTHSAVEVLTVDRVLERVAKVLTELPIDILVTGAREMPEIFEALTAPNRPVQAVYLWYNVLSDIAGMEDSDLVVNFRGEKSAGWGGWSEAEAEVAETFRFVCPNNPRARQKTLDRLRTLLMRHPFTGVFLDKIRFPSPANGLEEVASCFCQHCRDAAGRIGLDLDAVAHLLNGGQVVPGEISAEGPKDWLARIAGASPLLSQFLRFRMESITSLVVEADALATGLGRKVGFDLFSPGLAPLVGQDYPALARFAEWIKPMTYRIAEGPAGLRLEIPSLSEGVSRMFGIGESDIEAWAQRNVTGFEVGALQATRETAVPLSLMAAEIRAAVDLAAPVPVYFGLELVRHPGVVDITPDLVRDMIAAARDAKPAGAFLSWDLMHAPMDGIRALANAI